MIATNDNSTYTGTIRISYNSDGTVTATGTLTCCYDESDITEESREREVDRNSYILKNKQLFDLFGAVFVISIFWPVLAYYRIKKAKQQHFLQYRNRKPLCYWSGFV